MFCPRIGPAAWLAAILACVSLPVWAQYPARQRLNADFKWRFNKGDAPGAEREDFDDTSWRAVDLPHDWSIEGPYSQSDPTGGGGGYLPAGIGWYRRAFNVPETWRGKRVFVEFDGVYMNSEVWLNGQL